MWLIGFEFELNEQYGESLSPGTYKLKNDIYDLEGDIQLKQDDEIIIEEFKTNTILGYDVFKYNDVYLTTEDVYAN